MEFCREAIPLPIEERESASLWGDGSGRWRGGGGAALAVAHDLRHLLFLHIHGAELPVDRRFERGIGLHILTDLAGRYHGSCTQEVRDGQFTVSIALQLPENQGETEEA